MNTENNNINQLDELEQLRTQVAEFKSRLNDQEIINDRLLRDVVKGKVKSLRKLNIVVYVLGALGFILVAAACLLVNISVWPIIFLALLGVGEAVFSFWNLNKISGVSEMSVVDAQTEMTAFVRREKWLNIIEVPVVGAIIAWIYFSSKDMVLPDSSDTNLTIATGIGGAVGAIVGISLVAYIFHKQFRIIGNIRKSIDALKDETR